ncbi:MAG: hypothetical protein ACLROY_01180 [Mediterraneibacter sp.]
MDVAQIVEHAITTLGFPIVCVVFLGWFVWKIWLRQQEQNEKREEKLYACITEAQSVNERLVETNSEFMSVLTDYKADLDEIKQNVTEIKNTITKGLGE